MFNIGPQELLLILVIALVVVGPTRLPELGRSLGKGLRELRKAQDEVKRTIQVNLDDPSAAQKSVARVPRPTESDPRAADGAAAGVPAAVAPDPTPLAADPPPTSEIREISRTLGQSLAELRRAREEVQRGFRVDLDTPTARPTPTKATVEPAAADGGAEEPRPADDTPAG